MVVAQLNSLDAQPCSNSPLKLNQEHTTPRLSSFISRQGCRQLAFQKDFDHVSQGFVFHRISILSVFCDVTAKCSFRPKAFRGRDFVLIIASLLPTGGNVFGGS